MASCVGENSYKVSIFWPWAILAQLPRGGTGPDPDVARLSEADYERAKTKSGCMSFLSAARRASI